MIMKGILTIIKKCDDMDICGFQRGFRADALCTAGAVARLLEELAGMAQGAGVIFGFCS